MLQKLIGKALNLRIADSNLKLRIEIFCDFELKSNCKNYYEDG